MATGEPHTESRRNSECRDIETREADNQNISLSKEKPPLQTEPQRVDRFASSLGSPDQINMVFTLFMSLLIEVVTT